MKIKFEVVRLWLFGKLLEGGSSFSESFRSCQPSATYCIDFLSSSLFNIFERERELDRLSYYNFKVPATVYSESSCLLECTDSVPFSSTSRRVQFLLRYREHLNERIEYAKFEIRSWVKSKLVISKSATGRSLYLDSLILQTTEFTQAPW